MPTIDRYFLFTLWVNFAIKFTLYLLFCWWWVRCLLWHCEGVLMYFPVSFFQCLYFGIRLSFWYASKVCFKCHKEDGAEYSGIIWQKICCTSLLWTKRIKLTIQLQFCKQRDFYRFYSATSRITENQSHCNNIPQFLHYGLWLLVAKATKTQHSGKKRNSSWFKTEK